MVTLSPETSSSLPSPHAALIERKTSLCLTPPPSLLEFLEWWLTLHCLSVSTSMDQPNRLVLTTDTSLWDWGSHLQSQIGQGQWSAKEAAYSRNRLELRSIWMALLHFQNTIQQAHILVQTDNVSAKTVVFINRQGGTNYFREDRVVLKLDPSFMPKVNSVFHWA